MAWHSHFFYVLSICKTTHHLKSLNSLLILHGLIDDKWFLKHLLKACFHLGALDLGLCIFNSIRKPNLSLQNLVIRGLSNNGFHSHVLSVYMKCRTLSCPSNDFTFPFVIKACSVLGDFGILRKIHGVVLRTGYVENVVVGTALVDFYAKNGFLHIARLLIDRIPQPDMVSFNALIAGYSLHGYDHAVFEVFNHVFEVGLKPNLSTFASVIPLCTRLGCLDFGRSLHGFSFKFGYLVNDFLVPALISMYSNASEAHFSDARKLFELAVEKNIAVWNAMISAYSHKQMSFGAFKIFQAMCHADVHPNLVTFVSIIPSCELTGSLRFGESYHACVVKHGLENHISVLAALVSMYAKLGDISEAKFLFSMMPGRNSLSWNVMVSGYVYNGLWDACLEAFSEMILDGFVADAVTLVGVISACLKLQAVLLGKSVHAFSIRKGINSNLNVTNALLAFYFDCNQIESSLKLFQQVGPRNLVSFNTLMSRFVQGGEVEKAIELVHQLQKEGLALDVVSLISILPMICESGNLDQGKTLHGYAIKNGLSIDIALANALVSMYFKCRDINAGRSFFEAMPERCIVSWNTLIGGYRYQNLLNEVLVTFRRMIEDHRPNSITMLYLLPACCSQLQGKSIHAYAIRAGILQVSPLLTSLMFMYARFAILKSCLVLFETNKRIDVSLWNAVISVHLQTRNAKKAAAAFCNLLRIGLQPDNMTVLSLVSAYAQLKSIELAGSVMAFTVRKGFDRDMPICNALIDLYARCGNIKAARQIFDSLLEKDVISWSVMINGYGLHGDGEAALEIFSQMKFSEAKPDNVTFLSILSACSHAGLVEQGWMVFNSMSGQGILPNMDHYACMVDLLGRTGNLKEAYDMINKLLCKPSISLLESLLGACKIHGDVELGENIGRMLLEMYPDRSGSYVVLSNIYAAAGRWTDANRVRSGIEGRQLRKLPGVSSISVSRS